MTITCKHKNTKGFDLELLYHSYVEICTDCGASRSVWEQGESDWNYIPIYIDTVAAIDKLNKLKRELEDYYLDKLTTVYKLKG